MPVVGLNLGKNSIRAVELDKKKDLVQVSSIGLFENPKYDFLSIRNEDLNQLAEALKEFFNDMAFSTNEVVVGLNETDIFMRVIKMPVMNDNELKNSIKFEAEQYIPVPMNEINLSYQRFDVDPVEKNKMEVQIVAARKTTLDKYVELIRKARLVPKAIEPETIAIARVLGDKKDAPVGTLIMEIGLNSTLLIVVYGGFVKFSRNIQIGGDTITKALQQELNLDSMQADEYKKIYGMNSLQMDGKMFNVIKPVVDNIVLEINRAAMFFTNHNPYANIKRVILTGGTSLMPGLLEYVASNLDYEVALANPFSNLTFSSKLESKANDFIKQGPIFSTSIGLAMKGLK